MVPATLIYVVLSDEKESDTVITRIQINSH